MIAQDCSRYSNKILFQKVSSVQKADGTWEDTWTDYYCTFAEVNNLSGTEYWTALGQKQEKTVVVGMRWSPKLKDINEEDRLLFKDEIYSIQFIDNVFHADSKLKLKAVRIMNQQRTKVNFNVTGAAITEITVKYPLRKWTISTENYKASITLIPGQYICKINDIERFITVRDKTLEVNIDE